MAINVSHSGRSVSATYIRHTTADITADGGRTEDSPLPQYDDGLSHDYHTLQVKTHIHTEELFSTIVYV